ncbi:MULTISPECIES: efflux RND transporter permease subunit [Limnobacter]|uniref:Efflux RND transporter permease subunit n=1 Tax=Limnobacter profundi TaxID=2732163 RepID=A0ABX6N7N8_9BURK|nr:efflux RND transporter permease subunit [Limnobacter sp. SAORIC-580]MBA4316537.1 RND transporter [Alcaligenaceae bacterium]PZO16113.1 MAG: RND transporter [Betaproteobacteria bacterium]PZO30492.1 MAG: RND transporter [Betaproteobacteria bacterium]QJR30068.1 efflux RND transporter permease subunit [Limnobacter sp. SAORIC-580]
MNVSTWSIKNPIPAVMLFFLLTVMGLYSFSSMKIQQFPDIELPTVLVTASLPGASPSQLENDVARKIENSLATLQQLKHIYTKIQDGIVSITVEFNLEKDTQEAVDDVRSAVSRVRADLPTDLRDPVVNKLELSGAPVLAYTIASTAFDEEGLSWYVDDTITKTLLNVKGVGAVNRVGGVTREVVVELDPLKMQALGVSALDVSRQLRNTQLETAGGRADLGVGEQPLRTIATVDNANQLKEISIVLSNGRRVKLPEIATIKDTIADRRSAALLNGQDVVGFEITRSKGASEVEVGQGVATALAELKAQRPDLTIVEAFNFVEPVKEDFDVSMKMLYEGAFLAVVVVWFFLRDWRATFVSAVALPLSVIPAFAGMYYLGFSLNVVSLLAMSLVVGILVDDAIVEVENIVRHLRMGKSPLDAAREAADEIGLAVIATTFTLIAVFLPTAFMSGIAGKFFKQFGWTAALAVFASLVVARMLTPMMAAYMLTSKGHEHEKNEPGKMMARYLDWVRWALAHRLVTCVAAGAFFVGSIMLIPLLPTGFIPPDDLSQTQVYIELQPGSTYEQTRKAAEKARELISDVEYVRSVYTTIGGGAAGTDPFMMGGQAEVRKATLTVLLDPRGERTVRKQVTETQMREALSNLPGVRYKVGLGASGEKYVLVLSGEDGEALSRAASEVERDLRTIPGLGSIASSAALVRPEIWIKPDFSKAADLGVSTAAMGETLRVATMGDYDAALPKLNLPQRQVPIVVRLDDEARKDLSVLERLAVPSAKPGVPSVPLNQVATLGINAGPSVIDRYDRARNVNFEIELQGQPLGDVTAAVQELPSIKNLPPGVAQRNIGDAEVMEELFASFGLAMLTGVLCIFVVLVLLFKDFLQPVTILAALPLSLGGAFVGLLMAGKSFSMPSLIGLIMLMGIATKNSILLVEYAIVARNEKGMSRLDAVVDACHKRARPIIMTTIAMAAGMLPIAIGTGDADTSFRSPMAIAVIGGLMTSTFLSLLVIPVVYTLMDDFEHGMKNFSQKLGSTFKQSGARKT